MSARSAAHVVEARRPTGVTAPAPITASTPLIETPAGRVVPPSECGHISMPVSTSEDLSLSDFVRKKHGFSSVEDVLSGRGLEHIFAWCAGSPRPASEIMSTCDSDELSAKAVGNLRSMGVAVAAGSIPETGKLTFELADDEIEIGMGAHGEAGIAKQKLASADEVADQIMAKILADMPLGEGDEIALMINS